MSWCCHAVSKYLVYRSCEHSIKFRFTVLCHFSLTRSVAICYSDELLNKYIPLLSAFHYCNDTCALNRNHQILINCIIYVHYYYCVEWGMILLHIFCAQFSWNIWRNVRFDYEIW